MTEVISLDSDLKAHVLPIEEIFGHFEDHFQGQFKDV